MIRPLSLAPFALLVPLAGAQDFDFQVDTNQSNAAVTTDFTVLLPGDFKGAWDATTNPTGTRTQLGLFGDNGGNDVVAVSTDLIGDSSFNGSPSGPFSASFDTNALTLDLSDLDVDLLGGSVGLVNLSTDLLFSTFRTFNPNSLYIGGFTVNFPLGTADITAATLEQSAPSLLGVLVPQATPDLYDFTVEVPADLNLVVDFQSTPTPVGPVPLVLPLVGTLDLSGPNAVVTVDIDLLLMQTIMNPLPTFSIDDLPLPLPTILPPGFVADLLWSATIDSLDIDLDVMVDIVAVGMPAAGCGFTNYCAVNPNSSGLPASISVAGSAIVTDEDLDFTVVDLPLNQFGYFLMSETQDFIPLFGGGQGNLCVGAPIIRFNLNVLNSGAGGMVQFSPDFQNLPQNTVFQAGSTWNFQMWFRDDNPGQTSNTSGGIEVVFCP